MVKKTTTLTIDDEVIDKAKKGFINMSEVAEKAIKERLSIKDVEIETNTNECEFCGKEGEPETAKTVNKKSNGLSWLYPDEKWICNKCLQRKGRSITK